MNKWLYDCKELTNEIDQFVDELVNLEDELIAQSRDILTRIYSLDASVDDIRNPEHDEKFFEYSDEEADEMYDEWDRLLRIRDELLAYEKCFENVLRAFGSIYSAR